MTSAPNIVLIVLDTVRSKNLSCYNYSRDTTTFLDTLGDESMVFRNAYSPAPWTVPAHASLFTGMYVKDHKTNRENRHLNETVPTIAELLSEAGYTTVGVSNNQFISPEFGFDRGFDQFITNMHAYHEPVDRGTPISRIRSNTTGSSFLQNAIQAVKYVRSRGDRLLPTAANWLYRKAGEVGLLSEFDRGAEITNSQIQEQISAADSPFFVFANYMEGHAPYRSPDEYKYQYSSDPELDDWGTKERFFENRVENKEQKLTDLEDQYDGCIQYLDHRIEQLYHSVEEMGELENTLFIITGDHGESFGEHGLYEHESGVYNELSNVPLIIGGGRQDSTTTVDQPVSIRWLLPTLLNEVGIEPPSHSVKRNLFSPEGEVVIESEPLPYTLNDEMECTVPPARYSSSIEAVVDSGHKFIRFNGDSTSELYAVSDTAEEVDRSDSNRELVQELSTLLDERLSTFSTPARSDKHVEISSDIEQHLSDLGYR